MKQRKHRAFGRREISCMDNERFFDLFSHTQVYDLEQPRSSEAPLLPLLVPGFTYTLHRRHEEGTGDPRTAASGFIATTDHAGTHIDALCHVAEDLCLHGGEKVTFRIQTPTGFTRLGAETIAPLLSRGVPWCPLNQSRPASLPPGFRSRLPASACDTSRGRWCSGTYGQRSTMA